jgi:Activator of Hsp90 ATPase homolog 1-like protein
MALPPVKKSLVVPLAQNAAFDLFVRRLPEWWPLSTRSVGLDNAASCHVEAHVGGKIFERSHQGEQSIWGTFRLWEEPGRVVFSWHPGLPESAATEVDVRFLAMGKQTRVELEHRDWERLGARASFVHALYEGGWVGVLARFEALARGASELPKVEGPGCIPRP